MSKEEEKVNAETQEGIFHLAEKTREYFGVQYNLEGVKKIEQEIELLRNNFSNLSEAEKDKWVQSFGAFLGICMLVNYGGEWTMNRETIGIKLKGSNYWANPFGKVWKQMQPGGEYDSISSFYEVSKSIDAITKSADKNVKIQAPEKKPWWKVW
ncbi:MAG: hypothetical protein U0V74_08450 [Chitinophagales bacterium]